MREGYASVVRDHARAVHGLLWDLALRDVAALDRYEAVASGLYRKIVQPVVAAEGARRALVYVGGNAGPGRALPGYIESVVSAGQAVGLPACYIDELRQHIPRRLDANRPNGPAAEGRHD